MNRRTFLKMSTGTVSALSVRSAGAAAAKMVSGSGIRSLSAAPAGLGTTMGVVQYSFSPSPRTSSASGLLEYCHSLGAGGVQVSLDSIAAGETASFRRRAEELGMFVEAIVSVPKKDGVAAFEQSVAAAKQAGATCLRTACLVGRRYETFSTLDDWKRFVAESFGRLDLAVPILEKHKMAAGVENHKDWTADELVALINHYGNDYLGVCLDIGNNISLLDDPMEVAGKLAPYAVTTHFKDMAVEEDPDGFLLSEVPLGQGILDLRRVVAMISKARPRAHLSLEMITRDPLKIPCLTDKYWVTFPNRNGLSLARTLRWVRDHRAAHPLAVVSSLDPATRMNTEEDNVKRCLFYAREQLGLAK